jgi:hypothetical protein
MGTFNRVYQPGGFSPTAQDYFRLFMVFAVSSVTRYRASESGEHPYGYYLAAQNHLSRTPLVGSLDAIQNLLLVARFGMYHHIGKEKFPGGVKVANLRHRYVPLGYFSLLYAPVY